MSTSDAFAAAGIAPVTLAEKEGLALINGTDGMLGMLVLAIIDFRRLLKVADITAAMSVEGLLGTDDVFADDLHASGRIRAAARQSAQDHGRSEIRKATAPRPALGSRTPTRCAARRKSPAPYATQLIMQRGSP